MELCKKRLEILRTVPECPLNVWKYRGTIRNTCKMFGNVPEQSGMSAKCLEMFRNVPWCLPKVFEHSGTNLQCQQCRSDGYAEASAALPSNLQGLRKLPRKNPRDSGHIDVKKESPLSLRKEKGETIYSATK